LNKDVEINNYGTDRYGRTLGVVYVDGKDVNLEMVKAGLAEVYRGKPAPGFDNGPYDKAENEARSAGIGMWSLGDKYISPKEWRKMH
jgi:endonuclease YncB( thermonuclease family)